MNKNITLSADWIDRFINEKVRFFVIDNSELNINRGDVLFIQSENSTGVTGVVMYGVVTFVSTAHLRSGYAIVAFKKLEQNAALAASMIGADSHISGSVVSILDKAVDGKYTLANFRSKEDFERYNELSIILKKNRSTKPNLAMRKRYEEAKQERDAIELIENPVEGVTD